MFLKLPRKWMILECKHYVNSTFPKAVKEQWDLVSSVCLERKPVITKDSNEIETKYSELVSKIEFEMSKKSDHEMRMIKDKRIAEELKKEGSFIDNVNLQTAQEFEDACIEELKKFSFANRKTAEDLISDVKSTNRKLSDSLLLIIKQNIGGKSNWVLPQCVRQEGETMRQTAERALTELCGSNLQTKFLGNAPCGFYKFRYPKSANVKQSVGMKIFFFKAHLVNGNVSEELCSDFQWVPHHELEMLQEDYQKSVKLFLVEDESYNQLSM